MDSPIVAQLFRQLFRHPACPFRRNLAALSSCLHHGRRIQRCEHQQRRHMASRSTVRGAKKGLSEKESHWQQRTELFPEDMSEEYKTYPTVTANDLRSRRERPRKVKMLMRDFIEDSLYNPHYGYFSKQVVIFSPGEPFDFNSLRDEPTFHDELGRRYTEFEDALDKSEGRPDDTRQLWHTPTELFRPYYGEAIARYLLSNYLMTTYPYHDLIIYEMGAGRGTLMLNILDYIRDIEPTVYDRTKYKIIEISSSLAALQNSQLLATAASRGHASKVEIINKSIFDWDARVPSPCFFLAMEVFDNFAHDVLRYDMRTEEPLQGTVLIDGHGDFYEFYEPVLDPVAARFLRVRHAATGGRYRVPYPTNRSARWLKTQLPLAPNLSDPEYIPTRLMQFFDILERAFPAHRLVTSDFHTLPDAVRGLNAPVVQTRYQRRMVPVSTPLVHQGYFDILFPTDFHVMEAVYRALTGKLTRVMGHEAFMRSWAYVEDTRTHSGENPLLSWYRNASVMVTV
ncbi:NADH dehydrogenase [ubiquinone] complex I, assembly factor 7 like protein [Daldinia childiae]|uniref:NADH dehydrogenase [ubiquinone] complex I, assembly factor 7 like protein n=1 Tax=Daldinia childiae TaxID=326645 RepID=UPI00144606F8|nr:NADH dehydrogenase [ubiquinone] complex I, assembly factor 7 like protein [Daldinia childiae]KAF3057078.1 NADH dehydrogenase [ubiquinone] complex I, assembly factor 7 like protein [Daldinia childiae]